MMTMTMPKLPQGHRIQNSVKCHIIHARVSTQCQLRCEVGFGGQVAKVSIQLIVVPFRYFSRLPPTGNK
jgi:hypothetical protein